MVGYSENNEQAGQKEFLRRQLSAPVQDTLGRQLQTERLERHDHGRGSLVHVLEVGEGH